MFAAGSVEVAAGPWTLVDLSWAMKCDWMEAAVVCFFFSFRSWTVCTSSFMKAAASVAFSYVAVLYIFFPKLIFHCGP